MGKAVPDGTHYLFILPSAGAWLRRADTDRSTVFCSSAVRPWPSRMARRPAAADCPRVISTSGMAQAAAELYRRSITNGRIVPTLWFAEGHQAISISFLPPAGGRKQAERQLFEDLWRGFSATG